MLTVKSNPKSKEYVDGWPKLMIDDKSGLIVLAENMSGLSTFKGTVVKPNLDWKLAYCSDAWAYPLFKEYFGNVILENT